MDNECECIQRLRLDIYSNRPRISLVFRGYQPWGENYSGT